MRKNKLIILGLFILSLIAISFYGGPVSYGFFFFVLFTPIVSALYTIVVFFRFKIYQKIDAKVTVAETPVTFYYTLQNEDFFTFSGIKTDFFSDYSSIIGLDPGTEYELFPHTGIKKETRLICKYRGEYEVGVKNVTVRDYLKLFSFTFKNKETITVTVIPKLVILKSLTTFDALTVAGTDSYTDATEPDVLVRDYVPGDDIRSINWKLTAVTGKPLVRKTIGENTPEISIIMDSFRVSSAPDVFLPLENKILETTIALAYYYADRGIRVNVYTYSNSPVAYTLDGTDNFEDFYNMMSYFSFSEKNTPDKLYSYTAEIPGIIKSSVVIFVIHEPDDTYFTQIQDLKNHLVNTVTCIVTDDAPDVKDAIVIGYDDKLEEVFV